MLYNKYRPKYFKEVIGQEFSKNLLINILKQKANIHSFLFYGPNGTGKTTSARLFARAVNCENFSKSNDICDECENCKISWQEGCTDIIEIDAATHNGVEFIREIVKGNAIYPPLLLKKKIYLIDEAHCLTSQSWNSLLKIIEEPPPHLILIFLTTEVHKIIPTILSRCQKLLFAPLTENFLLPFLEEVTSQENKKIETELLKKVIEESNGSVRESLVLLEKIFLNEKEGELMKNLQTVETTSLELLSLIFKSNYSESLEKISKNLNNACKIFEIILDRLLELSFYNISSNSRNLLFNFEVEEAKELLKLKPNLQSMINFLAPILASPNKNVLKTLPFAKFVLLNLFHSNLKKIFEKEEISLYNPANKLNNSHISEEKKPISSQNNYSKTTPSLNSFREQRLKASDLPNLENISSTNLLKMAASDFPKLQYVDKLLKEEDIIEILNSCKKELGKERYSILKNYLELPNSKLLLTEFIKKINPKFEIICSEKGCLVTFSNDLDSKFFNLKIRDTNIIKELDKLFGKSINWIGISTSNLLKIVRKNNKDGENIKKDLSSSSEKEEDKLLFKEIKEIFYDREY